MAATTGVRILVFNDLTGASIVRSTRTNVLLPKHQVWAACCCRVGSQGVGKQEFSIGNFTWLGTFFTTDCRIWTLWLSRMDQSGQQRRSFDVAAMGKVCGASECHTCH